RMLRGTLPMPRSHGLTCVMVRLEAQMTLQRNEAAGCRVTFYCEIDHQSRHIALHTASPFYNSEKERKHGVAQKIYREMFLGGSHHHLKVLSSCICLLYSRHRQTSALRLFWTATPTIPNSW
uniref:Uncharacterized protein n=1 Tax=Anolis carolinensis TaxID=28377 RepID=G1KYY4_ANOCA